MSRFKLGDAYYEIPEALTIQEQIDVARELGAAIDTSVGMGTAMCWIAVRRVHPKTTLADIGGETMEIVEDEEDSLPPTSAAASVSSGESATTLTVPAENGTPGSDTTTASSLGRLAG